MNKTTIFAHYDSNNVINDYVIFYLQELAKISKNIVFVSDCDLSEKEINKLKNITNHILGKHHGEYDFGSYKYGYLYAKENNLINTANELIFANDSCFGPLLPFEKIWNTMQKKDCDFWGITKNDIDVEYHIQSFFLVFKENVFKTKLFDNFINSITKQENKNEIIKKYEIGLSKLLLENGFKSASYCNYPIARNITQDLFYNDLTPLIKKWEILNLHPTLAKFLLEKICKRLNSSYKTDFIINYIKQKKMVKLLKNLKILQRIIIEIKVNKKTISLFGKKIKL